MIKGRIKGGKLKIIKEVLIDHKKYEVSNRFNNIKFKEKNDFIKQLNFFTRI